MTPENFVYWLQGYLELANPSILDEKTILMFINIFYLVIMNFVCFYGKSIKRFI